MKTLLIILLLCGMAQAEDSYFIRVNTNTVSADGTLSWQCEKNGAVMAGYPKSRVMLSLERTQAAVLVFLNDEYIACKNANMGTVMSVRGPDTSPETHGAAQHDSTVPTSTDPRFSDARTPLAHVHPESDVTNLTTDLAAKSVNIGKGTATFSTTAIAAGACSATVTVAASGVLTSDVIRWSYASAPTASTDAKFNINMWPTANNVNFNRCNTTASSITPTAIVMNWQVTR